MSVTFSDVISKLAVDLLKCIASLAGVQPMAGADIITSVSLNCSLESLD